MSTDKDQFQAPSSESLEAGYETSSVSIKALAWFVVGLVIVAAIVHAGMWLLLKSYVTTDENKDQSFSALTDQQFIANYNKEHRSEVRVSEAPQPPTPRIQPSKPEHNVPAADLQEMFNREDDVFRQMGWEIDAHSHLQLRIPSQVVSAVIQEEANRQQQEKQPK